MKFTLNRRSFLKRCALAAGAVSAGRLLPVPNLLAAPAPGRQAQLRADRLRRARHSRHLDWLVTQSKDNVVAIVDPDEKNHAKVKRWLEGKGQDPAKLQTFTDYRVMFDKIGKQIDAVFIATPNHHHALPAMMAMQLGKAVYLREAAHPRHRRSPQTARHGPPVQSPHPNGQPGPLRGRLPPAL